MTNQTFRRQASIFSQSGLLKHYKSLCKRPLKHKDANEHRCIVIMNIHAD